MKTVKCKKCGEMKSHYAKNLCEACYNKKRYKEKPEVREYYKNKTNSWRLAHIEEWRAMNLKAVNKYNKKHAEQL